jgi:hypothetical protein
VIIRQLARIVSFRMFLLNVECLIVIDYADL